MDNIIKTDMTENDYVVLLHDIVEPLVEHPESIEISCAESEGGLVLSLKVHEEDVGKIIGKHGKIAHAIRVVTRTAAKLGDSKVSVDIV